MNHFSTIDSSHHTAVSARPSCATPINCSKCHSAYACQRQFGGSENQFHWPVIAILIFLGFGWLAGLPV